MKNILLLATVLLLSNVFCCDAQNNISNSNVKSSPKKNPLAGYASTYNKPEFMNCNTADEAVYLTAKEKEVIWILNMIRMNPQLFLDSVLLNKNNPEFLAPGKRDTYFLSLMKDLKKMQPCTSRLAPDQSAFVSAQCHAISSGKIGYVGHDRKANCKEDFYGECCDYGNEDPLSILLNLLIDRDVPSLGHRHICFDCTYNFIGVSIQPHTAYGTNCVLDFK